MKTGIFKRFRAICDQAFVPIFVRDSFDTDTLLEGCVLAGVRALEYTQRREDSDKVIPTLRARFPDMTVLVGSTIDADDIVEQMRRHHPQLLALKELAPYVDGFVSMLPFSDETLAKWKETHLLIPTAETSGEALRQMRSGATVIKVCGPDFSLSKKLHAAPTFNYCPTFLTGGVTTERMAEAYACGNMLTAAGFDLILKGEDPASLTPERVAERLSLFIEAAQKERETAQPFWKTASRLCDDDFAAAFPHYCSLA